jgi:hypothetical protein
MLMASEEEANNARRNFGGKLMKQGAHAIGVEEGKSHGKKGWVVVAHVAPDSKADIPSSLSFSTKEGEVEVPVVVARREPFSLE